jgi:hypothetical protein
MSNARKLRTPKDRRQQLRDAMAGSNMPDADKAVYNALLGLAAERDGRLTVELDEDGCPSPPG